MTMRVIREQEGVSAVFRVLECGCGVPDCDKFAIVGAHDRERRVWTTLGISAPSVLDESIAELADGHLDRYVDLLCGLVGCPFRRLLDPYQVVLAQEAWDVLPDWMMRLDAGGVWGLRAVVFGDDLVRVPAALWALHHAGDPGSGGVFRAEQEEIVCANLEYELPPSKGWQG